MSQPLPAVDYLKTRRQFGVPLVTVRATNVYGARQQLFKIIPRSAIYLKLGRTIELPGGGRAADAESLAPRPASNAQPVVPKPRTGTGIARRPGESTEAWRRLWRRRELSSWRWGERGAAGRGQLNPDHRNHRAES